MALFLLSLFILLSMPSVLKHLIEVLGKPNVLTEPEAMAWALEDWRGRARGKACAVLLPRTVRHVQRCVDLIRGSGYALVPQGGNTGLVAGQIPENEKAFILSTRHLKTVRSFNPHDYAIVAEAGCTIAALQQEAENQQRYLPLSLASQESCTVGGVLSTNAGGHNVIRFGSARENTLGIEVVLPDGTLISELNPLTKNNTGYDWKHLLIGAEGTLGIITAACLRVYSYPRKTLTFLASLPSIDALPEVCHRLNASLLGSIVACELMPKIAMDMVTRHGDASRLPTSIGVTKPWMLLGEVITHPGAPEWEAYVERVLTEAQTKQDLEDVCLASSLKQQKALWYWRSFFSEAQKREGASLKHDIAVPLSCLPRFLKKVERRARAILTDVRPVLFGHVGDGNIHCNFSIPQNMTSETFASFAPAISAMVYDLVREMGGSVSAEHGIGRIKKHLLQHTRTKDSITMMQRMKTLLDPDHFFNPGVLWTQKQ